MEKELTMQEREEMQNKAINAASMLIINECDGEEYLTALRLAVSHVEHAITLALKDVMAFDVLEAKNGVKERMFVAGVLRQISDRIRTLCIQE